jgi:hypothetical protein
MSKFERGEPSEYEVVWKSGHVDRFVAHQVSWPHSGSILEGEFSRDGRVHFHAEVEGNWTLILSAQEDDIATIRNVTETQDSSWIESGGGEV